MVYSIYCTKLEDTNYRMAKLFFRTYSGERSYVDCAYRLNFYTFDVFIQIKRKSTHYSPFQQILSSHIMRLRWYHPKFDTQEKHKWKDDIPGRATYKLSSYKFRVKFLNEGNLGRTSKMRGARSVMSNYQRLFAGLCAMNSVILFSSEAP